MVVVASVVASEVVTTEVVTTVVVTMVMVIMVMVTMAGMDILGGITGAGDILITGAITATCMTGRYTAIEEGCPY